MLLRNLYPWRRHAFAGANYHFYCLGLANDANNSNSCFSDILPTHTYCNNSNIQLSGFMKCTIRTKKKQRLKVTGGN